MVQVYSKRLMDIVIFFILLVIISPLLLIISILITTKGGVPFLIKQSKLDFMVENLICTNLKQCTITHIKRGELEDLSPKKGPLFKIDKDPRVIEGLSFSKIQSR